jgi:hypothetical protein
MMLRKVTVLSIMVAVLLSIAGCNASPKIDDASLKIESEWDAVLVVRDYLKGKYFDGENYLKLVVEEHGLNWDVSNDNYDVNDPPPVMERTWTVIANYEDAIMWTVNSAGKVIDGPFYPPC